MAKSRGDNVILDVGDEIRFPNSTILEDSTAGLVITGTSTIDASKIRGIPVDDTDKADGKVLAYDQATNTIKYIEAP